MIVLICGPDAALVRAAIERALDQHDHTRANTSFLDGRTATVSEIVGQVGSPGFFGQRRIVLVNDLMARAAKPGTGGDVDAPDERSSVNLPTVFGSIAPDNVLILADASLGAVPAAVKKAAPDDVEVVLGTPPRGTALLAWMAEAAETAGSSIDQPTARYLAELLFPRSWTTKPNNPRYDRPPDLDRLRNELEKLASAAYPGEIQRRHVDSLCHGGHQDQIFRFTDAVAQGRLPAALSELSRLLEAGEDPYRLGAQLYQHLELALVLSQAGGDRHPVEVGKALGLSNPNRMSSIARTVPPRRNRLNPTLSLQVERMTKQGQLRRPDDGIYHLITTGSDRSAKGGS